MGEDGEEEKELSGQVAARRCEVGRGMVTVQLVT